MRDGLGATGILKLPEDSSTGMRLMIEVNTAQEFGAFYLAGLAVTKGSVHACSLSLLSAYCVPGTVLGHRIQQ